MVDTYDGRERTAFEQFLNQRKAGVTIAAPPSQAPSSPPPRRRASPAPSSLNDLPRGPGRRGGKGSSVVSHPPSGFGVSLSRLSSLPTARQPSPNHSTCYEDLAVAAASLASAAQLLALTPVADPVLSRSYKALAQAASMLASSVRPSPASSTAGPPSLPAGPAGFDPSTTAGTFTPFNTGRGSQASTSATSASRAPTDSAAASQASWGRFTGTGTVPRFPAYDPRIHTRTSELRPPGTAQAGRPPTSSPITHSRTGDVSRPPTGASWAPSSRSSLGSSVSQRAPQGDPYYYVAATTGPDGELLLTGGRDGGSSAGSQVLMVDQQRFTNGWDHQLHRSLPAAGIRTSMQRALNVAPTTEVEKLDKQSDAISLRYNTAVARLKDRIHVKGLGSVTAAFRVCDQQGEGHLDATEFRKTLLDLNIGLEQEDPVLDLMAEAADTYNNGTIDYKEFVEALRFNTLPYRQYSVKFRHRMLGESDVVAGPTHLEHPFGTVGDANTNTVEIVNKMDSRWGEVKQLFKDTDTNSDGVVSLTQFKAALGAMSTKYKLMLSDEEMVKAFAEADGDAVGGVDYERLLASFEVHGKRGLPEFLKPKNLRCSSVTAPWEWRGRKYQAEPGDDGRPAVDEGRPMTAREATLLLRGLSNKP